MSNEYYQAGSTPAPNSPGASAAIRGQFAAIALAFDKLPTMAGSAGEFVLVNPSGTALVASGHVFSDFVTVSGAQTVTDKTFAWSDNTWTGFGTGATKNAGTGAGEVLLLAENNKLPALDGGLLTALPDDAHLGGEPTATTPPVGNASDRIATTDFVAQTVSDVGGAVPSNATPLINGVAHPGAHILVSRDDHVHPTDTNRAPASAGTAAGTSFNPVGGVIAVDVQAAIAELDSEKAPSSAGTAAGTSFVAGGGIIATNVQAAIAELDSEKAPLSSPTFSGPITLPQYLNVTQPYGALQVAGVDVMRFGSDTSGQLNDFRNLIINGGFQVNQRGSVALDAVGTFGPDRWIGSIGGGTGIAATFTNAVSANTSSGYSCVFSGSWTAGKPIFKQRIESYNCKDLVGKPLTISGKMLQTVGSSQQITIALYYPNTADTFSGALTLLGSFTDTIADSLWEGFSGLIGTLPAGAANGLQLEIFFSNAITVVSKTVALGDVQLEQGSIATRFDKRPIGTEFALCQRYYYQSSADVFTTATMYSSGFVQTSFVPFPVEMRVTPTVSIEIFTSSTLGTISTLYANRVIKTGVSRIWNTSGGTVGSSGQTSYSPLTASAEL